MHYAIPYSIVLLFVAHSVHSGNLISQALNWRQDPRNRMGWSGNLGNYNKSAHKGLCVWPLAAP